MVALAAVVVGIGPAPGSTDTVRSDVARCTSGAVDAVIAGKRVCLRRGQRCSKRLDRQYHRYGFHCHGGRLTGGPESNPPTKPGPAGKVIATVSVPSIGGIAVGGDAVWVANVGPRTVTRIDPRTDTVAAIIPLGEPNFLDGPTNLAFGHGSLWVLDAASSSLLRIDPQTNSVAASISLGSPVQGNTASLGIVTTPDAVWVANRWGTEDAPDGSVVRVDPGANRIVATLALGSSPDSGGPTMVAAGTDAVWVGVPSSESSVWVADCSHVRRVDTRTNAIVREMAIPDVTGIGAHGIALGFGSVWVGAGPLVRLDPASGRVTGALPLETMWIRCGYSIALGFGSVWVRQTDKVVRIQP